MTMGYENRVSKTRAVSGLFLNPKIFISVTIFEGTIFDVTISEKIRFLTKLHWRIRSPHLPFKEQYPTASPSCRKILLILSIVLFLYGSYFPLSRVSPHFLFGVTIFEITKENLWGCSFWVRLDLLSRDLKRKEKNI